MAVEKLFARGKRAWEERRGAVGVVRAAWDDLSYLSVGETKQELEQYWQLRQREMAHEQELGERATKLPDTIERFGGRVALVTNFGASPGETGPRQIGVTIAATLAKRGFHDVDSLIVNSLVSIRKTDRMEEFSRSREFIKEAFHTLLPEASISSNDRFHQTDYNLHLGELQDELEWSADFITGRTPEAKMGYVGVVSALELASLGLDVRHDGWQAYGEDYEKIKFGGVLMISDGVWETVLPGNRFDALPASLQDQSRQEADERGHQM